MLRQPPSVVAGKYEVLGRLGEGGQGSVWKVRHIDLDQIRALKWHPDEAFEGVENVQRFRREGLALAKLRHPHIVQVFDLGRDDKESAYYLVMEYVEGQNLAQRLKSRGRPTLPDALEVARQMAGALTYAHRQPYVDSGGRSHQGMIHRDIKPSNVLIRDQAQVFALLADFGLVKLGDAGERTTTGAIMGTYKYSAPEQLGLRRGREAVPQDFRADIFAFGLVLFELVEGRQFHHGLDMSQVYGRALLEDLEPEFSQPVAPRLHALVAACIRRFPDDRPESMAWVLRELEDIARDLTDDETRTVRVPSREAEPETDEDIERRIRALIEERERRRLQAAQTAARLARERAVALDAPALVGSVFEQAVHGQEDASVAAKAGRLAEASRLYEESARGFAEAEAAAGAARIRQAVTAAGEALIEARRRAEESGAPALAPDELARARALDERARAAVEAGAPEDAAAALKDAAAQYDAAAKAAQRTRRRRETAAARDQCGTAHAAADAAGAATFAPGSFQDGCRLESLADAALGDEDFEAALELYGQAARELEAAATTAARERGRRQAADARVKAEQARQASEVAEAPRHARGVYQRGCDALAAAAAALGAEDSQRACVEYERAREAFVQATAEAEAIRTREREKARQHVARARSDAEAAEAAAVASGAAEHARAALADARGRLGEARKLESRGDSEAAAAMFERATAELERARAAADSNRTDDAARAVAAAREAARRVAAAELVPDQFAAAERLAADGQAALAAGRHEDARRAFEGAGSQYRRAADEAAREQRRLTASREQMDAARVRALGARDGAHAVDAERWSPEASAAAARWLAGAEQAVAANDLERAAEGYAQAATAFAQATKDARRARGEEEARREAEADARRREEEARQRAAAREAEEARRRAEDERRRVDAEARRLEAEARRQEVERRRAEEDAARARAAMPTEQDSAAGDETIVGGDRTVVARDETVVMPPPRATSPPPQAAARRVAPEQIAIAPSERPARPEPRRSSTLIVGGVAGVGLVLLVAGYFVLRAPSAPVESVPPKPTSPVALEWAETSPSGEEPVVREGEELSFAARLAVKGGGEPSYAWYLDGARQAAGPTWRYAPDYRSGGATREVKVVASVADRTLERRWAVIVENVNRPPTISVPRAATTRVDVPAGGAAELHVEAADPDEGDALTYVWERGGARIASGSDANLSIPDPRDGDEVRVTVRDKAGAASDARVFALAVPKSVTAPTTPPAVVDAPPRLLGQSPPAGRVRVVDGTEQRFDVRAADPESGALSYTWLLNGRKVGSESRWVLADASELGGSATLEARVSDAGGQVASVRWTLERVEPRPEFVAFEPRAAEVNAPAGDALRLSARAASPRAGARIRYEWTLDGAALPGSTGGEVELPPSLSAGRHAVEVSAVDDRGVRGEPHRWTIRVAAPAPDAGISEADVRSWLARYRAAFESNDRNALLQLGVAATADEADKMVRSWGQRTVVLSGEQIERQGNAATVSFNRKDHDVEAGRDVQYPQRLMYRLEKGQGGLHAVRR